MKSSETLKAEVKALEKTIANFVSRVSFFEGCINNALEGIPSLEKQIATMKRNIPLWKNKLDVYVLSAIGHKEHLAKKLEQFENARKIETLQRKLHQLNLDSKAVAAG